MARKERYLVGLDVGTSKVTAVVGEMMDDGGLDIIGIGLAEARGIRRGLVVNLEAAVDSIKRAIDEAELTAGIEIDSVLPRAVGRARQGLQQPRRRRGGREEPRDLARRRAAGDRRGEGRGAAERPRDPPRRCRRTSSSTTRTASASPSGMTGSRLEVNVHIITGNASTTQNVVACVNRAGVAVVDTVLEQLAAAEAVLTPDERELGRGAGGHRRRHDRLRDLRAGQPVAHRRGRHRRRPLHQRHRGRPADARARRGAREAPRRVRALGHGRRRRDDGGRRASADASRA